MKYLYLSLRIFIIIIALFFLGVFALSPVFADEVYSGCDVTDTSTPGSNVSVSFDCSTLPPGLELDYVELNIRTATYSDSMWALITENSVDTCIPVLSYPTTTGIGNIILSTPYETTGTGSFVFQVRRNSSCTLAPPDFYSYYLGAPDYLYRVLNFADTTPAPDDPSPDIPYAGTTPTYEPNIQFSLPNTPYQGNNLTIFEGQYLNPFADADKIMFEFIERQAFEEYWADDVALEVDDVVFFDIDVTSDEDWQYFQTQLPDFPFGTELPTGRAYWRAYFFDESEQDFFNTLGRPESPVSSHRYGYLDWTGELATSPNQQPPDCFANLSGIDIGGAISCAFQWVGFILIPNIDSQMLSNMFSTHFSTIVEGDSVFATLYSITTDLSSIFFVPPESNAITSIEIDFMGTDIDFLETSIITPIMESDGNTALRDTFEAVLYISFFIFLWYRLSKVFIIFSD